MTTASGPHSATPTTPTLSDATYRKVARRLLPFLGLCYFLSYLDRTNISVAALTMNDELGITATVFGLGAGLFFIGYFLFEVPSNLILHRVGARIWIARIMVSWGVLAVAQALIQGETSLYILRFLLGVAEAGFFPGIILYLTFWFPADRRGRVVGLFMAAIPVSTAIGAPLGGLLLRMDGLLGLSGWQWLFIVEGVPTVVVGFLVLRVLTDRPEVASWLSRSERDELVSALRAEEGVARAAHGLSSLRSAFTPRVALLALVYFTLIFGLYGLGFWMPTVVKSRLDIADNLTVTLLTAAPYAVGTVAIILWGRVVDRRGGGPMLTVAPMAVGGAALAGTALVPSPWVGYAGLFVCAVAIMTAFPGFWRMPTALLTGVAAAAGIAVVNSFGNLAGFVGPYWVGWITDLFGDAQWGLVSIGVVMATGALIIAATGGVRVGPTVSAGPLPQRDPVA
ncbi:MAG: MFS transporter [Dermatophilaceae bacterium]